MNKIKSFFFRFSRPRIVLSLKGIVFYGEKFLLIQRSDKNSMKHYKWVTMSEALDMDLTPHSRKGLEAWRDRSLSV